MPRVAIPDGCSELLIPRAREVPRKVMVASPGTRRGTNQECAGITLPAFDNWILSRVELGKDTAEDLERIECDHAEQLLSRASGHGRRGSENWLFAHGAGALLEAISKSTNPAWYKVERPCWISGDGPICALLLVGGKTLWIVDVANYVDSPRGKKSYSCAASLNDSQAASGTASPGKFDWHGEHDSKRSVVHAILTTTQNTAPDCWAATAGGIGWSFWRRHHITQEVYHVEDNQVGDIERRTLYGGRVECFRLGDFPGRITRLDRVSHYPATARDATLPIGFPAPWSGKPAEASADLAHGRQILAAVDVCCDKHTWPNRENGRISWVCGRFSTWLASAELGEAIRLGCVARINRAVCYTGGQPLADVSRCLIDARMSAKATGNHIGASLLKRMSTGLYGRLIRRKTVWARVNGVIPRVLDGEWTATKLKTGQQTHYRAIQGIVEQDVGSEAHEQSCVALGACLFSAARVKMNDLIRAAGPQNVMYLGVDGIHVNDSGRTILANRGAIGKGEPGSLQVEKEGQPCVYRGLYAYTIGDTTIGKPTLTTRLPRQKIHLQPNAIGEPPQDEAKYKGIEDTLLANAGPLTKKKYHGLVRPDGRIVPRCLG